MQKTEYRCVGGCVGGWGNDSLVLTLVRQKKTTLSGTTADDARPYEGLICCEAKKKELRRKASNNTQQQVKQQTCKPEQCTLEYSTGTGTAKKCKP